MTETNGRGTIQTGAKRRVSLRISDATYAKLKFLSRPERYGTQSEAVAVAIDRMWRGASHWDEEKGCVVQWDEELGEMVPVPVGVGPANCPVDRTMRR